LTDQRGQAIILLAIMIAVVVGMAGMTIDGARAYALRRDLQAAVDAAALAAGDRMQQSGSYTSAEQAASTSFGTNLRLYSAPACSPGYGAPGASPHTVTCTFSDGTTLSDVATAAGPQGSIFSLNATRSLQLTFARVLVTGSTPVVSATSGAETNGQVYTPAIAALDQAGCGGTAGNAISVTGGGTLSVIGDVVANGSISVSPGDLNVAGDIYARCQTTVPGTVTLACYPSGSATPCTYPDVAGAVRAGFRLVDPAYPPPAVAGGGQGSPGDYVVLSPGLYAADPAFNSSRCYFLSAGVYDWVAGYTNAGGFVSNELKPPDEPTASSNTSMGHQMWDTGGVNCAGSFQVSNISAFTGIAEGSWGIELTATRTDTYSGTNYKRESAPSMCRIAAVGDSQAIKLQISNVPGATAYNVYASPPSGGCSGPFGLAGSVVVSGPVRNDSTAGCPAVSGSTCSLGNESAVLDASILGGFAPNPLAAPGVIGAYPPSGESPPLRVNLPNQNPARATPPAGDRANENQCDSLVGAPVSCPGTITPGAVEFYVPNGGCMNASTSGDNFLFSGYQYDWLMVYEPGNAYPPANTCSNMLGAAADSAWVGLLYLPSASLNVQKAATFRTEATGGLMADTITFSGQLPEIIFSANFAPTAPASKLVS